MTHPSYLGWQVDWPLFVKVPFDNYKQGQHFNWLDLGLDPIKVSSLYASGQIYHNKELEVEQKVGDRLEEFEGEKLKTLVKLVNDVVKSRTNSTSEYTKKKCKQSAIDTKQRGLLRSFLRNNRWIEDEFYEIRDGLIAN